MYVTGVPTPVTVGRWDRRHGIRLAVLVNLMSWEWAGTMSSSTTLRKMNAVLANLPIYSRTVDFLTLRAVMSWYEARAWYELGAKIGETKE
jgi:hypothetical protein